MHTRSTCVTFLLIPVCSICFLSPLLMGGSFDFPSGTNSLSNLPPEVFLSVTVNSPFTDTHIRKDPFTVHLEKSDPDEPLRFCLLSDIHENARVARKAVQEINALEPDFTVFNGDLTDVFDIQEVAKIHHELDSLKSPLFPVMGNHERMGGTYENYLKLFGVPNYAFIVKGYLFLVVDSSRGFIDPKVIHWMESILKAGESYSARFVITHVPLKDPRPEEHHSLTESSKAKLLTLLKKYNVTALFNGHIHQAFDGYVDGVRQITGGFCGGRPYNLPSEGSFYHVLLAVVIEDQLETVIYPVGNPPTAWDIWTGELKMRKIYLKRLKAATEGSREYIRYSGRINTLKTKFARYRSSLRRAMNDAPSQILWTENMMKQIKIQPLEFQLELAKELELIVDN